MIDPERFPELVAAINRIGYMPPASDMERLTLEIERVITAGDPTLLEIERQANALAEKRIKELEGQLREALRQEQRVPVPPMLSEQTVGRLRATVKAGEEAWDELVKRGVPVPVPVVERAGQSPALTLAERVEQLEERLDRIDRRDRSAAEILRKVSERDAKEADRFLASARRPLAEPRVGDIVRWQEADPRGQSYGYISIQGEIAGFEPLGLGMMAIIQLGGEATSRQPVSSLTLVHGPGPAGRHEPWPKYPFESRERFAEVRDRVMATSSPREQEAWWKRPDVQDAVARGFNDPPAAEPDPADLF